MKNRIALLIAILITTMSVVAQNEKSAYLEKRNSKSFRHININGEFKVKLMHSTDPSVVVDGNDFEKNNTITIVMSDTLFIYRANSHEAYGRTKLIINASDLESLEVNGKTKVDCSGYNIKAISVKTVNGAEVVLKASVVEKSIAEIESFKNAEYFARWTPVDGEIVQ